MTDTIAPARFVTPQKFEAATGITVKAVERKIERGVWAEGKHFVLRDGRRLIDMQAFYKWAEKGV